MGTVANTVYRTAAKVIELLPATVTISGTSAKVPVTWSANSSPAYNSETAGTYVFTGTIGELPDGYKDQVATISTVTVNVILAKAEVSAIMLTKTLALTAGGQQEPT